MAANTAPIYSIAGDIQGGDILTTAAADYTGQGINNVVLFTSNAETGGFVQRIRFKAIGTNVATVARIYVNNGMSRLAATITPVSGTPTGTPSASGGTLYAGSFFAKIIAVDQYGGKTTSSTESASVAVTGSTGSITWNWTAVTGAVSYLIFTGPVTNGQSTYFTSTTNSYVQTTTIGQRGSIGTIQNNNSLYGEVSLPAITVSATAPTSEVDYPLNFALPPGERIVVGLGTTVAAGWIVTCIGGRYA